MASTTNNARELSRLQTWDQSEVTRPAPVEAQVRPERPGDRYMEKGGWHRTDNSYGRGARHSGAGVTPQEEGSTRVYTR